LRANYAQGQGLALDRLSGIELSYDEGAALAAKGEQYRLQALAEQGGLLRQGLPEMPVDMGMRLSESGISGSELSSYLSKTQPGSVTMPAGQPPGLPSTGTISPISQDAVQKAAQDSLSAGVRNADMPRVPVAKLPETTAGDSLTRTTVPGLGSLREAERVESKIDSLARVSGMSRPEFDKTLREADSIGREHGGFWPSLERAALLKEKSKNLGSRWNESGAGNKLKVGQMFVSWGPSMAALCANGLNIRKTAGAFAFEMVASKRMLDVPGPAKNYLYEGLGGCIQHMTRGSLRGITNLHASFFSPVGTRPPLADTLLSKIPFSVSLRPIPVALVSVSRTFEYKAWAIEAGYASSVSASGLLARQVLDNPAGFFSMEAARRAGMERGTFLYANLRMAAPFTLNLSARRVDSRFVSAGSPYERSNWQQVNLSSQFASKNSGFGVEPQIGIQGEVEPIRVQQQDSALQAARYLAPGGRVWAKSGRFFATGNGVWFIPVQGTRVSESPNAAAVMGGRWRLRGSTSLLLQIGGNLAQMHRQLGRDSASRASSARAYTEVSVKDAKGSKASLTLEISESASDRKYAGASDRRVSQTLVGLRAGIGGEVFQTATLLLTGGYSMGRATMGAIQDVPGADGKSDASRLATVQLAISLPLSSALNLTGGYLYQKCSNILIPTMVAPQIVTYRDHRAEIRLTYRIM